MEVHTHVHGLVYVAPCPDEVRGQLVPPGLAGEHQGRAAVLTNKQKKNGGNEMRFKPDQNSCDLFLWGCTWLTASMFAPALTSVAAVDRDPIWQASIRGVMPCCRAF